MMRADRPLFEYSPTYVLDMQPDVGPNGGYQ